MVLKELNIFPAGDKSKFLNAFCHSVMFNKKYYQKHFKLQILQKIVCVYYTYIIEVTLKYTFTEMILILNSNPAATLLTPTKAARSPFCFLRFFIVMKEKIMN